jgi:molybdenum cofactor cytidylyltransferase
VAAYVQADLDPVIVVLGHEAQRVADALDDLAVHFVQNPGFKEGQSRALVCGVRAMPETVEGAVIGVGDQPLLRSDTILALMAEYRDARAPLVVPRYGGKRGNPVLFDRRYFPELLQVEGDQGGRQVLARHGDDIIWVDIADPRQAVDLDTLEDFERLRFWV